MSGSGVRERPSPAHGAGGPAFDLVVSKLRRPPVRPGTVLRASLIDRLARDDLRPVVSVVAAAGYEKTTLLSQWAECTGQAFAWVSVDEKDNDPKVLLTYIAQSLGGVQPVGPRVFDALASSASSVPGSVVPRLGSAFAAMTTPVVLVLDDVHLLHNPECRAALSVLADHVPPGSRLTLAGREEPPLRVARLRAEGKITQIGARDLALTRAEAASLLRAAGVSLCGAEVAELHQRTEGWAAGLYLAALYVREDGAQPGAAVSFSGGDRLVSEYVESEFLARISPRQRVFLTRTAVLERMCGPLCEAVLDLPGSAATLAGLARSNLLLVPLDRRGEWYRYHHLFRGMLLAELHRNEPELIPGLQRRAAQWYARNGEPEEALEYWMKAGDVAAAAPLIGALTFATYQRGMAATAERWLRWLDDHAAMEKYPAVAVLAAAISAVTGKAVDADRWAKTAERGAAVTRLPDGSSSIEPWLALIRALLCHDGVEQMRADAELAASTIAAGSFWRATPILLQGMAHVIAGEVDRADMFFDDAVTEARATGGATDACVALAERSLLAMASGMWDL